MSFPRRLPARTTTAVLAAATSAALLAGCASGTTSKAAPGSASPAAATSTAASAVTTTAVDATALATRVAAAVAQATSVHVSADLSGLPIDTLPVTTAVGDVALSNGVPTAAALTAGSYALRYVDGTGYVTLPGADAAAPWTLLATDSTNPVVATAAKALASIKSGVTDLDPGALLDAGSDLHEIGPDTVGGVATTEYAFTVDPVALVEAFGVTGTTKAAALGPVPVQVWLDANDRPVQLTAAPTVGGRSGTATVTLTAWDAPVSIVAPTADQVSG